MCFVEGIEEGDKAPCFVFLENGENRNGGLDDGVVDCGESDVVGGLEVGTTELGEGPEGGARELAWDWDSATVDKDAAGGPGGVKPW